LTVRRAAPDDCGPNREREKRMTKSDPSRRDATLALAAAALAGAAASPALGQIVRT